MEISAPAPLVLRSASCGLFMEVTTEQLIIVLANIGVVYFMYRRSGLNFLAAMQRIRTAAIMIGREIYDYLKLKFLF